MDKALRKELKHDKFVEQVGHSVEYAAGHKKQVTQIGIGVAAIMVLAAGGYWYLQHQHSVRQEALRDALRIQDAAVGASQGEFIQVFATQAEKDKAVEKAFNDLSAKYPSKDEGLIAKYYLGIIHSDQGKLSDAEREFKTVIDAGNEPYASQAKYAQAQLAESQGRANEAEKLYRELIARPTILVSKEQATIALARMIGKTKPAEARKMLEELRGQPGVVGRAAITALSELSGAGK